MPKLTLVPLPGHPQHRAAPPGEGVEGAVGIVLDVLEGTTVLDAALANAVGIATLCGGAMQCKTCRVRLLASTDDDAVSPKGQKERGILEGFGLGPHHRLACQVKIRSDVVVLLPSPDNAPPPDDDDEPTLS